MIIFHEGLPGSGKSYEAAITRIIPALKKGRKVFAYIEGLNFEKFAEITGVPLEKIKGKTVETEIPNIEQKKHRYVRYDGNKAFKIEYIGLLHQLTSDQVPYVHNFVEDDSLVILDELQDFFPVGTKKLSDEITKFVTQHRHRGLDIVVMGQDHRDCHNLWKRRVDQLIHFTKRDAIGRSKDYTWTTFKQNQGKFKQLRSGKGTYDEKYFGLYLSHVAGAENTETYNDDRSNVFKSSLFRLYLPMAFAAGVFAVYYLYSIFTGDVQMVKTAKPINHKITRAPTTHYQTNFTASNSAITKPPKEKEPPPPNTVNYNYENYVKTMADTYRPRLAGLIEGDWDGKPKIIAYIEFLDKSFHVHEKLELKQLQALGWKFERKAYGINLSKDETVLVITAWPIDSIGRVSNRTRSQL